MGGENDSGGGTRARRARRGVEKIYREIRSPPNGTSSASEASSGVPTADTNAPSRPLKRGQHGDAQMNSECPDVRGGPRCQELEALPCIDK